MEPSEVNRVMERVTPRVGTLTLYARQWAGPAAADDVVQEAMVRLLSLRQPPIDSLLWMFRAVRNAAIDAARATSRRQRRERVVAETRREWFDPDAGSIVDARAAEASLGQLPHETRQIVLLRVWGDLGWAQIAELVGLPLSTVHDRYRQALARLRDAMEKPCLKKTT